MSRRNFFENLVLGCISVLLRFSMLEALVRFIPTKQGFAIMEQDKYIGERYKKNLDIKIPADEGNGGAIHIVTNSHGFIGDEWGISQKGIRIANLGDSFTAGTQAVSYEGTYVTLLGKRLSSFFGLPTESLNFGVGGFGGLEELNAYRHYVRESKPDIVILWVYLGNDFSNNIHKKDDENENGSEPAVSTAPTLTRNHSITVRFLQKSKLLYFVKDLVIKSGLHRHIFALLSEVPAVERLLYNIYLPAIPDELTLVYTTDIRNEKAILKTEKYITELQSEVHTDGALFFVVLIPAHFQVDEEARGRLFRQYPELTDMQFDTSEPNKVLARIFTEYKIPFLDLAPQFEREIRKGVPLYACRFCHFSAKGQQLAAELVADELSERYFKIRGR